MVVRAARLFLIVLAIVAALSVGQAVVMTNTFQCVRVVNMGICYWYHGK